MGFKCDGCGADIDSKPAGKNEDKKYCQDCHEKMKKPEDPHVCEFC